MYHHTPHRLVIQGMVEGKVFIVDMRERTTRGTWKSPEQRESSKVNMVRRLDLAMRGAERESE